MAVAACTALSLVLVPTAAAQSVQVPPAPGNLIANWGFDTNTAGWGSFNGTLTRGENGSLCSTTNPGAAMAASAAATGKPGRIVLRERVGTTGAIVKETASAFKLGPAGTQEPVVVSAQAVRSGSTLGLRIEQSGAQAGDAFTVDDVFLRRPTRVWGPASPGTIWTRMSSDLSRVSTFSVPDNMSRYLDRLRVYLDGRGGATGSQKLRAVVYERLQSGVPALRMGTSREVTVTSGMSARWVGFRFAAPVSLNSGFGAVYQFGIVSGPTGNVARYASTAAPAALRWGPDRYADGPNLYFGTAEPQGTPTWSTDDKQMSIQGIAAPVGESHPASCF